MSRKETGAFGINYTIVSVFCGRYRGMFTYRCKEGSLGERSGVHWASWLRAEREQPQLVRCVVAKCSCHRGQMLGPGRYRPRTPCVAVGGGE